jgi:hypothetical protein
MDGREWLDSYQERLRGIRAVATRAERELAGVTGTASSRDGAVTVTVGPAGALQGLVLSEGTEGMTRAQLADTVLATARRARHDAEQRAEAALVPVLGERSDVMALIRTYGAGER